MFDRSARIAVLAVAGAVFVGSPAAARPRHHRAAYADAGAYAGHAHAGARQPYGYGDASYPRGYGGYYGAAGWEGQVIARRTAQAYHEPGVTLELAPDAKLTATGGPVGGVPGFDSD